MDLQDFITRDGTVLVVDDVPSALKVIARLLNKLGVKNVVEVANGEAAIQRLMQRDVNLIISDWNMPDMDGLQLLSIIRKEPATMTIPFILITSSADRDEVVHAYKSGISDYIVKPFNGDTLSKKLTAVLSTINPPSEDDSKS
jgi:two-component system chemotaxis response regulator CheY